jgi:predicted ATP-grasp superfamily ATP-dependent carboligase
MRVGISGRPLLILVHEWVTGGGMAGSLVPTSWGAEGRAMRRAIATDFAHATRAAVRVQATHDARLDDDPGPWAVAPIAEGEHTSRLSELARAADFTVLIAPETTGILAGVTRELKEAGANVLGSSPGAIDFTADKAHLADWLLERGVETPPSRTVWPTAGLPADVSYPAILKPIDGAGSIDTFYLENAGSIPEGARQMSEALLQPFVPGLPMSASFLVDGHGDAWLIGVGTQSITIREGRVEYRGGTLPASSHEPAGQAREVVQMIGGLRGFVGVDFIWDSRPRRATILEINPRPTTSCVGLTRLLPAGCLADAWLGVFESDAGDPDLLDGLWKRVHGRRRVSFDSYGASFPADGGFGECGKCRR